MPVKVEKLAKLLDAPPADKVKFKIGSRNKEKTKGMALAYVDARYVMSVLDEICGPANWKDRYEKIDEGTTVCYLSINVEESGWIEKCGFCGVRASQTGQEGDQLSEKSAESDSLKRAAVKWGIARNLYDRGGKWIDLKDQRMPPGMDAKLREDYAKVAGIDYKPFHANGNGNGSHSTNPSDPSPPSTQKPSMQQRPAIPPMPEIEIADGKRMTYRDVYDECVAASSHEEVSDWIKANAPGASSLSQLPPEKVKAMHEVFILDVAQATQE